MYITLCPQITIVNRSSGSQTNWPFLFLVAVLLNVRDSDASENDANQRLEKPRLIPQSNFVMAYIIPI